MPRTVSNGNLLGSVNFNLSHPDDKGIGRLQARLRYGNSPRCSVNLGYLVNSVKWNAQAQECVPNTTCWRGRIKVLSGEVNKRIREISADAKGTFAQWNEEGKRTATLAELRAIVLGAEEGSISVKKLIEATQTRLTVAYTDFMQRQSRMASWSDNTLKRYNTVFHLLKDWNADVRLEWLTTPKLENFLDFLRERGYKDRTTEKALINLKTFLSWAERNGYAVPPDYKDFKPRIKTLGKTIVWLDWDEVKTLLSADLSGMKGLRGPDNRLELVRDMFCFSCLTGLRYSDIVDLKRSDIRGGKAFVCIDKTGERVSIELNRHASAILARYEDEGRASCFPYVANATCNEKIKRICRFVGITEKVCEVWYQDGKRMEKESPKCELVTMHTGRRSFICNALEKGIAPSVIMKWTGHKSYTEMQPYIDISERSKEIAMKLFDD